MTTRFEQGSFFASDIYVSAEAKRIQQITKLIKTEEQKSDNPLYFAISLHEWPEIYQVNLSTHPHDNSWFHTKWTDKFNNSDDNHIGWLPNPNEVSEIEGFLHMITSHPTYGYSLLHLVDDITDIDTSHLVAVRSITEVGIYPDNVAFAYWIFQENLAGTENDYLLEAENMDLLEEMIEKYWPKPTKIWP